ncbi:hypothetical protein [Pseudodesulfovibrio sediminis]|uniref:Uncharacterized protein n=1 Tax=Pseudodesulfovibrio sediminis TaxID=2810563 RepID=A0ABN6EVQ9_9BACT|nr:hypothetical protein [Pseudodesulfovibrio sediminis]BCS89139.1 hypothetical protein PSDVSF_23810 [Pseudodesulfovibrio sediminis]
MFKLFAGNYKKAGLNFLKQHTVGQRIYSYGDGGAKMQYLRECGYIVSDQVSETRWVHKIISKPKAENAE